MESVLAAFAQFDNDVRSDRTRAGMKAALELGRWVFLAPIGYLNALRTMGKSLMAAATVDTLRVACHPKLTLPLASVSEGWWPRFVTDGTACSLGSNWLKRSRTPHNQPAQRLTLLLTSLTPRAPGSSSPVFCHEIALFLIISCARCFRLSNFRARVLRACAERSGTHRALRLGGQKRRSHCEGCADGGGLER